MRKIREDRKKVRKQGKRMDREDNWRGDGREMITNQKKREKNVQGREVKKGR